MPHETHDGLTILTEHNWEMRSGYAATMNWTAWIDGQEEFGSGFGKTEEEAIADIRERWEEREDTASHDDGQPSEQEEWRDYDSDC